jgi:carboxyl-terminal processing protease
VAYRAVQQQAREANKQQTAAQNALPALEVTTLSAAAAPVSTDSSTTKRMARFLKPLRKDAALAEAVAVIGDELK